MPHAPDLSGCALDDRYELHAVIGEGAFGRVYRGWDRRLERWVAIKLIKPWWAEDPDWAQSFEREAQLLARVSHPGIVGVFDVGHASEGLYYVSELVNGESLANRIDRGPLAAWDAAAVAEQLCRALGQAHAQRVVHRDVKPANILLSAEGRVKVGDFGVARLAEGSSDGAGATIVGTPRYMAPEQARGRRTTPATDVYSSGIVLYEMLAGHPPFTERAPVELALRHLRDRPEALPAAIPAPLREIVNRALAKDPGKRFRNGSEMAEALSQALESARVSAPSSGGRDRTTLRPRSHPARRRSAVATGAGPRPLGPGSALGPPPGLGPGPPRRPGRPRGAASGRIPEPTRRAPRLTPRRNLNPAARRRSVAALVLAFSLLGSMIVASVLLGGTGYVRVPNLASLRRAQVQVRARRVALRPSFSRRYSAAAPGTVIAQRPGPDQRVQQGSTVRVVLSAGPPPVAVPQLAGDSLAEAQTALARIGLRSRATQIVAPGVPAGTVTSQSPAPGAAVAPPGRVAMNVAETPHWQPITALTGSDPATTVDFRVRGGRWRIVYTMSYRGTCTFIVVCSGPGAQVDDLGRGTPIASFDLSNGGRQTREFVTGPGRYRLTISPGSDTAGWSAWIEDSY